MKALIIVLMIFVGLGCLYGIGLILMSFINIGSLMGSAASQYKQVKDKEKKDE